MADFPRLQLLVALVALSSLPYVETNRWFVSSRRRSARPAATTVTQSSPHRPLRHGIESFTGLLASTAEEIEAAMKEECILSRVARLP